jgi:hypothetical protein
MVEKSLLMSHFLALNSHLVTFFFLVGLDLKENMRSTYHLSCTSSPFSLVNLEMRSHELFPWAGLGL